MGANGSTAISSSSLDISHKRQLRHQLEEHHNRMQEHKSRHLKVGVGSTAQLQQTGANGKMKQSNSYFDLTTSHLLQNETHNQYHLVQPSQPQQQQQRSNGKKNWFDTNQSEAYSISNANIGPTRPIMVLPSSSVSPPAAMVLSSAAGNKKSNAGAANRIHHQRQQQRTHELKKFSDSLPSLNNIMLPAHQSHIPHHQHHHQRHHHHQSDYPPSHLNNCHRDKQPVLIDHHHKSAKQTQQPSLLNNNNIRSSKQDLANSHLVRRKRDSSSSSAYQSGLEEQQLAYVGCGQQLMKRAISLSSLHNIHHIHQQQQQQRHLHHDHLHLTHIEQQQQQQHLSNSSAKYRQLVSSNKLSPNQQSRSPLSPELMNNYASRDLRVHQSANRRLSNPALSSQKQPQQLYNQPTPLSKKILKFKQSSNRNAPSNRRYKSQQQQQQLQQHGCPVLPPLPRSQSLHELIQLRATENGQRMRTTGTLRGPLGAPEALGNKVNLVAELLETRRQQKLSEETRNMPGEGTMLSQSSSSDDGIHDVSITGDQSTGDSRREFSSREMRPSSIATSGDYVEQRFLKKSSHNCANGRKFNKRTTNYEQQQVHSAERPQSQQVGASSSQSRESYSQQAQGSTLRRSQSHSALHSSSSSNNLHHNNPENSIDNDDDQSDDLNELAKFLYQFKQRQTNKSSPVEVSDAASTTAAADEAGKPLIGSVHDGNSRITSNLQQSPNSTTSSSGFASSTCTSNSISSAASSKEGRFKVVDSQTASSPPLPLKTKVNKNQVDPSCEFISKKSARKKYPAPPRPDEGNSTNSSSSSSNSSTGRRDSDEYNSTLQSSTNQRQRVSPEIGGSSNHLASVLLNGEALTTARPDSLESNANNSDEREDSSRGSSNSCSQQCQQLEQLKRYTQLRQMSQSELALNHLTSSSSSSPSKIQRQSGKKSAKWTSSESGNCEQQQQQQQQQVATGKHYKSKLFNLIKRISDKSEVSGAGCGHSRPSGSSVGGHRSAISGCRQQQQQQQPDYSGSKALKTINQSEQPAPHLNRDLYKSKPAGGSGNNGAFLSESLCDLNFDCDLELIKNCGSNENRREAVALTKQQPQQLQQQQQSGSSLLLLHSKESKASPLASVVGKSNGSRQKEAIGVVQQQVVTSSSSSSSPSGNWRLAPSSLSLAAASVATDEKQQRPSHATSKLTTAVNQAAMEAGKSKGLASKLHAAAPTKSKWSASSWLMKSGSGNSNSKNKQKQQQSGEESAKSCVTKLISNSGTPQSVAQSKSDAYPQQQHQQKGKQVKQQSEQQVSGGSSSSRVTDEGLPLAKEASIEYTMYAKVNSEANQLLDELDHSLDLVSANSGSPFSRKAALHWWNLPGDHREADWKGAKGARKSGCDMNCSSSCTSDDDHCQGCYLNDGEDDDNDNDDYTSISRAMINATLGVDEAQANVLDNRLPDESGGGSPSDSFTFSAPNSPEPKLKSSSQVNAANQAKISQLNTANYGSSNIDNRHLQQNSDEQSKQQVRVVQNGDHQRELPLKQSDCSKLRRYICNGNNNNHVISSLSTSTSESTSQGGGDSAACGSGGCGGGGVGKSVGCKEVKASSNKLATNGCCNLDGKRIVSYGSEQQQQQREQQRRRQSEPEDGKMIMGRRGAAIVEPNKSSGCSGGSNKCTDNKHDYDNNNKQLSARQVVVAEQQDLSSSRQREIATNCNDSSNTSSSNGNNSSSRCTSASLNNNLDAGGPKSGVANTAASKQQQQQQSQVSSSSSQVPSLTAGEHEHRQQPLTAYDAKTNGLVSKFPSAAKLTCTTAQLHKQPLPSVVCCAAAGGSCNKKAPLACSHPHAIPLGSGACCDTRDHNNHLKTVVNTTTTTSTSTVVAATKSAAISRNSTATVIQGQRQQQSSIEEGQSTCCHNCRAGGGSGGDIVVDRISHFSAGKRSGELKSGCCHFEKSKLLELKSITANNGRPPKGSSVAATAAYEMSCATPPSLTCDRCAVCSSCDADQGEKAASQRDLHNNGFTFCRKTATTSEDSNSSCCSNSNNRDNRNRAREENKLIIHKLASCSASHCDLSTSSVTTTDKVIRNSSNGFASSGAHATGSGFAVDSDCLRCCESTSQRHPVRCPGASGQVTLGVERQEVVHRLQNVGSQVQNPNRACCNRQLATAMTMSGNNNNNDSNCCTGDDDDIVVEDEVALTRCKVAACHHPSSKLSQQTNCNEDVKQHICCVSRDNLISKAGQKLEEESGGSGEEQVGLPQDNMHDDCASCQPLILQQQQQQQQQQVLTDSAVTDSNGKLLIKRSSLCMTKHSAAEPQQVSSSTTTTTTATSSLSSAAAAPAVSSGAKGRLLSGASRLINIHSRNPICRSNSELVSVQSSGTTGSKQRPGAVNPSGGHTGAKEQQQQLFGRLRNSLLNRKEQQEQVSGKLASSQFSLINYCAGHYVSPFVQVNSQPGYVDLVLASSTGSAGNQLDMNLDDNFILKRKTPNAGLKSRC